MAPVQMVSTGVAVICVVASFLLLFSYLIHINDILKGVPEEVRKLSSSPWTEEQLRKTYKRLEESPVDYTDKLPPKLDRRYVITGGNGKSLCPPSEGPEGPYSSLCQASWEATLSSSSSLGEPALTPSASSISAARSAGT